MKLRNSFAILAFSAAFLLTACSGGGDQGGGETTTEEATSSQAAGKVTVTFDSRGGSSVAAQTIDKGAKVTKPANPTRAGYDFDAWYLEAAAITEYDFNESVMSSMTLYANWIENAGQSTEEHSGSEGSSAMDTSYETGFLPVAGTVDGEALYFIETEKEEGNIDTWLRQFKAIVTAPAGAVLSFTYDGEAVDPGIGMPESQRYNNLLKNDGVITVRSDTVSQNLWFKVYEDGYDLWLEGYTGGGTDTSTPAGDYKYCFRTEGGEVLSPLVIDGTDPAGRDQASILGFTLTAGTVFQLYDTENNAGWVVPVEPGSLGGNPDDYISTGPSFYTVLQTFTADCYVKFKMGEDSVYFGAPQA